jgi:hypothetical protein
MSDENYNKIMVAIKEKKEWSWNKTFETIKNKHPDLPDDVIAALVEQQNPNICKVCRADISKLPGRPCPTCRHPGFPPRTCKYCNKPFRHPSSKILGHWQCFLENRAKSLAKSLED